MNIDIICPLYNASSYLLNLYNNLINQKKVNINKILFLLTESTDNTLDILNENNFNYELIKKVEFSHSLTREKYALMSDSDIIVFITQDIIPKDDNWLYELVNPIINKEAEALLDTLFNKIKNLNVSIIYNGNDNLKYNKHNIIHEKDCTLKKIGYINIFLKLIFSSFTGNKYLKKFDNIVDESDYIIVSPSGANIGIYRDYRFLIRLLFVVKRNKKPIFYLNTIGKSKSFIFNNLAKKVLLNSIIYVREKKSYEYLHSMNIKSKLGVDTAFLLDYKPKKIRNMKKIILILSDISSHPNFRGINSEELYSKIISTIGDYALSTNKIIEVIPHLNTIEENLFIKKILNNIDNKRYLNIFSYKKINDRFEYIDEISSSYFVVSMRYHGIVMSIKNSIPFISLSYENKMNEVCSYSNSLKYNLELFSCFDIELFNKLLLDVDINNQIIRSNLMLIQKSLYSKALLPFEVLNEK